MKSIDIKKSIAEKRYRRRLKSKRKRKRRRRIAHQQFIQHKGNDAMLFEDLMQNWLPPILSFLLYNERSMFHSKIVTKKAKGISGVLQVPKNFSLINEPKVSYEFIQKLLGLVVLQEQEKIEFDYSMCQNIDLEAQVLFDAILKESIILLDKCSKYSDYKPRIKEINGINIENEDLKKMLTSVGSQAIHQNKSVDYDDIVPYHLCVHDRKDSNHSSVNSERKDIDTTKLADYVIDSLAKLGKTLTPEKKDDLCVVISEILINAEEHSTTNRRYSIGYFKAENDTESHYGVFRLVIMNFGETIYEKFKSPQCPNQDVVKKMKKLSEKYERKNFFTLNSFEEDSLWTLYSLQEGVTSVSKDEYIKRGNGSIRFIESFFKLKGNSNGDDQISKMAILSGNTNIIFDGTYEIVKKVNGGDDNFSYMTFNKSGRIEDKPDKKFVKHVKQYFPGTIITAKILLNEDDIKNDQKI